MELHIIPSEIAESFKNPLTEGFAIQNISTGRIITAMESGEERFENVANTYYTSLYSLTIELTEQQREKFMDWGMNTLNQFINPFVLPRTITPSSKIIEARFLIQGEEDIQISSIRANEIWKVAFILEVREEFVAEFPQNIRDLLCLWGDTLNTGYAGWGRILNALLMANMALTIARQNTIRVFNVL